ncbi:stage II sporulation protein R [Gemmiger sp.]
MTNRTRRVLEWGFALGLALTVVLNAVMDWRTRTAAQVRADTIRLHILANSDTWDDQLLKLQVRNAVLAALPPAVTDADTPQQAADALQTALPALQAAADAALHRAHSSQTAALRLERCNFAARDYGSFALPAGEYNALRVELGAAQGRNWFCVLYPALCISGASADYPTKGENALVFGKFEVRVAAVDFIKQFK